ncbi:MAG: DMT family transporter [Acidobacteria bacterium]|nr:DMT family transporter [Acidobacteriota bacterium]
MDARRTRGLGLLLLGAGILGFAAVFVRWSAPASPLVIGFYRMLFALPGVLALAGSDPAKAPPAGRPVAWALGAGVFFISDLWLWHLSLRHTSAANATLLVGLSPLWVALTSMLLFGARLRRRAWGGLALALAGACVLGFARGARWGSGLGELLGALASVSYAFFTLALARARQGLSARRSLAWVVVTCLAGFGLLAWLQGDPFGPFPWRAWASLAGLGILVQVLAWWCIAWGLGHVDANLGSIGLLVQPVATVGLGWLLLGESVKPVQGLGAALILAGITLSALSPPSLPAGRPRAPAG